MAQKIYDLSIPLEQGMPAYPGDPRFRTRQMRFIEKDGFVLHKLIMGDHAGTHVDAPGHLFPGHASVADLPLEMLNGRARVIEIHNSDKVDAPELREQMHHDNFRILFKTRNSLLWRGRRKFKKDYIYITAAAAQLIVDSGIKLVGFDYLSVDRFGDETYPVHRILLKSNVIIVEGLNLAEVEEGSYDLNCLPLKLQGLDAAPARVILRG
jgi:arylformamidase